MSEDAQWIADSMKVIADLCDQVDKVFMGYREHSRALREAARILREPLAELEREV